MLNQSALCAAVAETQPRITEVTIAASSNWIPPVSRPTRYVVSKTSRILKFSSISLPTAMNQRKTVRVIPRGGRVDWPRVGIFAQRGRMRPNLIGASFCRLLGVDEISILVEGLDAVDNTPILYIKPAGSGELPRGECREPPWVTELMKNCW